MKSISLVTSNLSTYLSNTLLPLCGNYFVTGTDTEVGKTTVTAELIRCLAEQGKTCYAIKPVTAGVNTNGESDDARQINTFATVQPPVSAIAPIVLQMPCSPHIASKLEGVTLALDTIVDTTRQTIARYPADCILVEGAGGWFTPINEVETLATVAIRLDYPVILVVGIKLGCLNHAVLTLQAIWQAGGKVAMIVCNGVDENTDFANEQIHWLKNYVAQALNETHLSNNLIPIFCINPFLGQE